MTPLEFFLTLIVAPVSCSVIMLVITHRQKQFREGWELYEKEKLERRKERDVEMQRWQQKVCDTIDKLSMELDEKVNVTDHKTVALKVDEFGERIIVLEVKVRDIRNRTGNEVKKNERD